MADGDSEIFLDHSIRARASDETNDLQTEINRLREDVDIEIFEGEAAEASLRFQNCTKYPGHGDFHPINEISLAHLPEKWREPKVLEKIQFMSRRTVHISVPYTSTARPDSYGFDKLRGTTATRTGSGWAAIDEDNLEEQYQLCPFADCSNRDPHYVTPEFQVFTATHVVYDNDEVSKTKVMFFFDSENDPDSIVVAQGCRMVFNNGTIGEMGMFTCISHDLDLFEKVLSIPNVTIPSSPNLLAQREPLVVVLSHPHGFPKQFTCGNWTDLREVDFDNLKFIQRMGDKKMEDLLPMMQGLLSALRQSNSNENLCNLVDWCMQEMPQEFQGATMKDLISQVTPFFKQGLKIPSIPKNVLDTISGESMIPMMESAGPFLASVIPGFSLEESESPDFFKELCEANPGASCGEHIGGANKGLNLSFIGYSAPTCQGSSGAPVFLLFDGGDDQVVVFWAASHFGTRHKRNISCFTHDIPDVMTTHPVFGKHVSSRLARNKRGGPRTAPSGLPTTQPKQRQPCQQQQLLHMGEHQQQEQQSPPKQQEQQKHSCTYDDMPLD